MDDEGRSSHAPLFQERERLFLSIVNTGNMAKTITTRRKRTFCSKYWSQIFAFFLGCLFMSLSMTIFLHQDHFATSPKAHKAASNFAENHLRHTGNKEDFLLSEQISDEHQHSVAGLDCAAHGGPSRGEAQEMVYWRDLTDDTNYVSPFHEPNTRRYLTFEPDGGGWNNIRMAVSEEKFIVKSYILIPHFFSFCWNHLDGDCSDLGNCYRSSFSATSISTNVS
jgi:hypothetical protein